MKLNFLKFPTLQVILTAAAALMFFITSVSAQPAAGIDLSQPDLSQYPQINLTFRATDDKGMFVKDLQAGEVEIVENNQRLSADALELVNSGVQFIVAVNEGPTLANRYSGVSRLERIKTALYSWISAHDAQLLDEFRLFTNQGAVKLEPFQPADWSRAVENYQPDLRNQQPGVASLSSAVDAALSLSSQTKKTTAILFITPLPHADQYAGLKDIFTRAGQNGIHIFVWLVGPQDYAAAEDALKLKDFSEQTGGTFFLFSGSEELPAITEMLDPLGYVYRLSYKTSLNISGDYSLFIRAEKNGLALESEPVSISLKVAPPNPFFLAPPVEITRSWSETRRKRDSVLEPDAAEIKIMVEFPDGMQRGLQYSRLFVDNKLAAENKAEPFTEFTWDISEFTTSGSHELKVVVEDTAGLTGETIEVPVDITVLEKPMNFIERVFARVNIVNGIIGTTLILLTISGIIALIRMLKKRTHQPLHKPGSDPVTQPVEINGEYSLAPLQAAQRIECPVMRGVGLAPARLVRKSSNAQEAPQPPEIPLSGDEVTIGSERKKVDVVLTHPSISGVHARIFKDAEGYFRVSDAGSNAGTWVNYAPVSTRGARLEHGDLVQFGRIGYVFEMHGAAPKRVHVLPYRED